MTLRILGLSSSLKGEIIGIMAQIWRYGISVVLDGNSLKWKITVQALKMTAGVPNKSCGPAGAPNKKCGHTRRFSEQKVRMSNSLTFMQKARARGNFYDWSMVFSPMFLLLWFWSAVLHLKYWTPVLGPLYWLSMVLIHGLNKGLPIKRKGDQLARHSYVEYLKTNKNWNTCNQLVSYSWTWAWEDRSIEGSWSFWRMIRSVDPTVWGILEDW